MILVVTWAATVYLRMFVVRDGCVLNLQVSTGFKLQSVWRSACMCRSEVNVKPL